MLSKSRNLVLVHGLWDDPSIFNRLISSLDQDSWIIFTPHLPHEGGNISLMNLSYELNRQIVDRFGTETSIDLLGFSMGGLICRSWLQNLRGDLRTSSFISVGSPHLGTYTAQFVPSCILPGVAEMKRGSPLLRELNDDLFSMGNVRCFSFFDYLDLMVIPGWDAVLPLGEKKSLCVPSHRGLISHPVALKALISLIIKE